MTGAPGARGLSPGQGPGTEDAAWLERSRAAVEQARARLAWRGPVDIRLVRRLVGDGVPRRVLDACLLRLEDEGVVHLTPHARPGALDALELADCVPSPRGPLYFVTWLG